MHLAVGCPAGHTFRNVIVPNGHFRPYRIFSWSPAVCCAVNEVSNAVLVTGRENVRTLKISSGTSPPKNITSDLPPPSRQNAPVAWTDSKHAECMWEIIPVQCHFLELLHSANWTLWITLPPTHIWCERPWKIDVSTAKHYHEHQNHTNIGGPKAFRATHCQMLTVTDFVFCTVGLMSSHLTLPANLCTWIGLQQILVVCKTKKRLPVSVNGGCLFFFRLRKICYNWLLQQSYL